MGILCFSARRWDLKGRPQCAHWGKSVPWTVSTGFCAFAASACLFQQVPHLCCRPLLYLICAWHGCSWQGHLGCYCARRVFDTRQSRQFGRNFRDFVLLHLGMVMVRTIWLSVSRRSDMAGIPEDWIFCRDWVRLFRNAPTLARAG